MDNKDFWEHFLKGDDEKSDSGKTPAEASLDPDYRAEEKPVAPDISEEQKVDIDAILADIHKRAATIEHTEEVAPPSSTPPTPLSNAPPEEVHGSEQQVMQDMLVTMRQLTEEVKQLRAQIGTISSKDSADSDKTASDMPTDNAPAEYFSGFVLEDHGDTDPEAKPDIRGEPEATDGKRKEKKKGNKAASIISNILFYAVIVSIVLGAFLLRSTGKGRPFMLAGYSMANVLTSSMENVYPKGSLIITKSVDAEELRVGDDITFMVNEDTTFTHRIIGITENYQNTGERAFETKGTTNKNPDKDMVAAANVVGKVVFHSKALGSIANFMKANWIFVIFVLVVIMALIFVLKRIFREDSPPPKG